MSGFSACQGVGEADTEVLVPDVLVVDDQIENCRPLVRLLRAMGRNAAWVTSGPAALKYLQEQPTRLVILDVMMRGMDGMEVLKRIRAEPQLERLPVVMFSALSDEARVSEAHRLGAQDYLVKASTDFEMLRKTVDEQLGHIQ